MAIKAGKRLLRRVVESMVLLPVTRSQPEERGAVMRNRIETVSEDMKNGTTGRGGTTGYHHYWIIESPNGSSSRGICKFCKEAREFNNSVAQYILKKK